MEKPKFETIEEFHIYAEEHAHEHSHVPFLGAILQKTRDLLVGHGREEGAKLAQIEMDALNFDLRDGDLGSMFSGVDKNGRAHEYPSIEMFGDERGAYIERRFSETEHPVLSSRFAHLLWKSTKKIDFGRQAIDSYLETLELYEKQDTLEPEEHFGLIISQSLITAFKLSLSIKDKARVTASKTKLLTLLRTFNPQSPSQFNLFWRLTDFMTQNRRQFQSSELREVLDLSGVIHDRYRSALDFHAAIQVGELGIRLCEITGMDPRAWHIRIGECYEELAKRATDPSNPVAPGFLMEAIEHLRRGGASSERLTDLEKAYEEAAKTVRYGQVTQEVDLSPALEECRRLAAEVRSRGETHIIEYLMYKKGLIPPRKALEEHTEELDRMFPIQSLAASSIIDDLAHEVQRFTEEDERRYFGLLRNYPFWLETTTFFMLREFFLVSVLEGELSFEGIVKYLRDHSWIARQLRKPGNRDNEENTYNWLELVTPGLYDYFIQIKWFSTERSFRPNFTLTVDSLVLKIEGMLRDMCALSGIPTTLLKKDRRGRNVSTAKDIHMLLYEKPVRELFSEDDLLFLRFVLVEQAGYNLRHRIAHGLTTPTDYSLRVMHLVLLIVLRIARYQIREKAEATSHK